MTNTFSCKETGKIWNGSVSKKFLQIIGEGSGEPRKSGREEPDRRGVWVGEKWIRHQPDPGKTQKYKSIVDLPPSPYCAQPIQIGRQAFFSCA